MKNILWTVGGICLATFGIILLAPGRNRSVEDLAHRLEIAWADNHTSL